MSRPSRRQLLQSAAALSLVRFVGRSLPAQAAPPPPEGWSEAAFEALREQTPIPEGAAYLNTGTLGISPRVVQEAVIEHLRANEAGLTSWDFARDEPALLWGYRFDEVVRAQCARLLGCAPLDLGFTQNATMGLNIVAHGLELPPGAVVFQTDEEHPGGKGAWLLREHRGEVRRVEVPLLAEDGAQLDADGIVAAFEDAFDAAGEDAAVLSVSHITSSRGVRLPVERLVEAARRRGLFTVLDGAQVLGQEALDLPTLGAEAWFTSPHKWLLAPKGTGLLYLSPAARERLRPTLASGAWDDPERGTDRFTQVGTGNLSLAVGLGAAVALHERLVASGLFVRNRVLSRSLVDGLRGLPQVTVTSPVDEALRTAATSFRVAGLTALELQQALWEQGRLRVRAQSEEIGVRACVHGYVGVREVDAVQEVVRRLG